MSSYYSLTFLFQRLFFVLVFLILPLTSAINIPLDLVWLQGNCMNLVATAGTMAALSLVFLFERIEALPPQIFMRILATISILYFLFGSLAGLMYQVSAMSNVVLIQILFWYTSFGIMCLTSTGLILFISQRTEVIW